jgi:hypothetical protein
VAAEIKAPQTRVRLKEFRGYINPLPRIHVHEWVVKTAPPSCIRAREGWWQQERPKRWKAREAFGGGGC